MKIPLILTLLLLAWAPNSAHAQFTIKIGKDGGYRSGAYEGYWSPHHTPRGWNHRMAEIRFENESRAPVDVFHVDRHGTWNWVNRLAPRASTKVSTPVGDVWVIRGGHGRVLERVVARPGQQNVAIRYAASYYDGDRYAPRRTDRFHVVFRNRTRGPVTLYSLQPWGEWVWAGTISPHGSELEVRAYDRQQFRVVDRRGDVISQYKADERDRRVTIKD